MPKKILKSKTKTGAVLISIGTILVTAGKVLSGDLDLLTAVPLFIVEIGVLDTLFGIRDALDKSH